MSDRFSELAQLRQGLIERGWRTPDTYCNCFASIEEFPAVYLFLLVEKTEFRRAVIAYVGMSVNLKQRMSGHSVLAELNRSPHWPMRWFRRMDEANLRDEEARLIAEYDPPWNIQGRRRGLVLQ